MIHQVHDDDQGEYSFVAEDHPTCSITAALEMTGGRVTVEKKKGKIFASKHVWIATTQQYFNRILRKTSVLLNRFVTTIP